MLEQLIKYEKAYLHAEQQHFNQFQNCIRLSVN